MSSSLDTPLVNHASISEELETAMVQNPQRMPRSVSYDALVLDAHLRQSLVTVRSLGRRGFRVAALGSVPGLPALSSRWCQAGFRAPPYEQHIEPYLAYLRQLLNRIEAGVLITSSDDVVALIRQHRQEFDQRARVALAKEPALGIATNKEQTLEIAQHLGLSIPRGVEVKTVGEGRAAVQEIGLPAVVKPVESWVWGADAQQGTRIVSRLVTTLAEARRAVEELTSFGGSVLFQQFLSGRREAVNLLYAQGTVYARFAQWAKRTQPPLGGTSVFRQSIAIPPDIGEQAERLVREIDLEGYSEVEFRRDAAGKPYLMEINPRLSASVEVAVRAGVDFPYLLYQWAAGEPITKVESYRVGGWMRFLAGDLMTTIAALQQHGRPGVAPPAQAIWDFCASFFIPSGYDYLDWKDLLPAFTAMTDFTGSWIGSALMKRLSHLKRRIIS
jgi:predicted ATP-grasp superfamily ATP-dependent carboligase